MAQASVEGRYARFGSPWLGAITSCFRATPRSGRIASLLKSWSRYRFPTRDLVRFPRPLSLPSPPTKADYNPDQVFPLLLSDREVLLFSDGSKKGSKVGAAFIHFRPPAPTTGIRPHPNLLSASSIASSHLLSLPWHMSVFDAELFAASCALQYAAALSPPPKVFSLGVDNQAALYATSRPGYSY